MSVSGFGTRAVYGFAPAFAATMLFSFFALAESSSEGGEHASGGLPQLNPESYPSQIFWLLLCFFILYTVMSRRILPKMNGILEHRAALISGNLTRAEKLREEAETVKKKYEEATAKAESGAADLIAETSKKISEDTASRLEEISGTVHTSFTAAVNRLSEEKVNALEEIRLSANGYADAIIARLLDIPATPEPRKKG